MRFTIRHLLTAMFALALVGWALRSAATVYYTEGALALIEVVFGGLMILLSSVCMIVPALRKTWPIATALILIGFSARQTALAVRLSELQGEANHIIAFVDRYEANNGRPPNNLDEYA